MHDLLLQLLAVPCNTRVLAAEEAALRKMRSLGSLPSPIAAVLLAQGGGAEMVHAAAGPVGSAGERSRRPLVHELLKALEQWRREELTLLIEGVPRLRRVELAALDSTRQGAVSATALACAALHAAVASSGDEPASGAAAASAAGGENGAGRQQEAFDAVRAHVAASHAVGGEGGAAAAIIKGGGGVDGEGRPKLLTPAEVARALRDDGDVRELMGLHG